MGLRGYTRKWTQSIDVCGKVFLSAVLAVEWEVWFANVREVQSDTSEGYWYLVYRHPD